LTSDIYLAVMAIANTPFSYPEPEVQWLVAGAGFSKHRFISRFPLSAPLRACLTLSSARGGEKWAGPTGTFLRQNTLEITLAGGSTCIVTIDRAETVEPRPAWKIAPQVAVMRIFFPAMVLVAAVFIVLTAVGVARGGTLRIDRFWTMILVLVGTMLCSRLMLLGLMDIAVFSHETRHFFVCAVILPVFLAVSGESVRVTKPSESLRGEDSHSQIET
jgi:hypothetical protein